MQVTLIPTEEKKLSLSFSRYVCQLRVVVNFSQNTSSWKRHCAIIIIIIIIYLFLFLFLFFIFLVGWVENRKKLEEENK